MIFNYDLQNAVVAFVDSIRPMGPAQHDLYMSVLYGFADQVSGILTSLGFPPR